ncbi:hypothetical protein [Paracidovorax citrulli]|uniref:hypothetical protein n=1 Tax=Paracidovorax citrulli TaxID=80869 RepID=UPI0002E5999D|nr:hypothetical protein [Paracidovorax citrulli]UEG47855.1 hypothetical protein LKW27_08330 [Paracidovorax citrulli]
MEEDDSAVALGGRFAARGGLAEKSQLATLSWDSCWARSGELFGDTLKVGYGFHPPPVILLNMGIPENRGEISLRRWTMPPGNTAAIVLGCEARRQRASETNAFNTNSTAGMHEPVAPCARRGCTGLAALHHSGPGRTAFRITRGIASGANRW